MGLTVLLMAGAALAAPQTWELRDGRWQRVEQPVERPDDPMLDQAEQLLDQREHRQARRIVLRWLRQNRDSPLRDRAMLLLARAYFQYGDRIRSFYHLDELMDVYPDSPLYYAALEMQYDIADRYLRGYRQRFFLIPILPAQDEAIEMLFRIQQRSPGSPIAERALLRTANFYYADRQFDLAADAYAAYARSYPHSPLVPRARLREAFSNYAQFRGLRFDATPLVDARAQLVDLVAEHPDLADEENLHVIINRIDRALAQKMYLRADYYRRTRARIAEAYAYQRLIEEYPQTPEAEQAQARLERMSPDVVRRAQRPRELEPEGE